MSRQLLAGFARLGALPPLLAAIIIFFAVMNPTFITPGNLLAVSQQSVFLLLIAVGQMLVLISGGFDLSVGSNVALTSIITSIAMRDIYASDPGKEASAITVGLLLCIVVGCVVGLTNGIGVAFMKVNPFIVTLATGSIFSGVTLLVSGGQQTTGLPPGFILALGSGVVWGIPVSLWVALPIAIVVSLILHRSRYGRYVYAIGSNETAATVAGVRVRFHLTMTYVACGVLTSLAAWLLTARVSSGQPLLGSQFPLQSIAAAIIGGASLKGGRGGVGGAILGVIFIMLLTNGMNLMRLGSNQQAIAVGAALVVAVIADRYREVARAHVAGLMVLAQARRKEPSA